MICYDNKWFMITFNDINEYVKWFKRYFIWNYDDFTSVTLCFINWVDESDVDHLRMIEKGKLVFYYAQWAWVWAWTWMRIRCEWWNVMRWCHDDTR